MQNKKGRTYKSLRNIKVGLIVQFINLFIVFFSRTIFIKVLGVEYLGISGLFTSVLTILSLGELGIGESITYALYKPLADNNKAKIKNYMNIFKKFYRGTAVIILALGVSLLPVLKDMISNESNVDKLHIIFLLFVFNSSISYLFSYKRILLVADQKSYKTTSISFVFNLLMNIFQVGVLLYSKNYILYLIIQIIFTLLQNIYISVIANKEYPYLNDHSFNSSKLNDLENKSLKTNIKALMIQKIGGVTSQGLDNIVISNFISVTAVGLLSNYTLLVNYISKFINIFFDGIIASVGNLNVEKVNEKKIEIFNNIYFGSSWLYSLISITLFIIMSDFIGLWLGEDYILSKPIAFFIVINFYFTGMRHCVNIFKNSMGLYWYDRYKPFLSAIVNLVFSIILSRYYGIIGVLCGTSISLITTNIWIEPLVLFKYGFKTSSKEYFIKYFKDFVILLLNGAILTIFFEIFKFSISFNGIVIKGLVSLIIINFIYFFKSRKKPEFIYYKKIFQSKFSFFQK